jgi:hypothetical protein
MKFKPQTTINCHIWDGYNWNKEPRPAMLLQQTDFPDHKFYITYSDTHDFGYRLTEYSTGMTIGGSYPEPTANKAAKWYKQRLETKGAAKILQVIGDTINKWGVINHA